MGGDSQIIDTARAGGCQCGAVRYRLAPGPVRTMLCFCRMCQRATGGIFAPLMEVDADRVEWRGRAVEWSSSNIANRGFCPACGTPLYYRWPSGDKVELMTGALEGGPEIAPGFGLNLENKPDWIDSLADLPECEFHSPEPVRSLQSKLGF